MEEMKKTNERNTVAILNPVELIKWCKNRKATLGLSNAKLAEMSGVPIGTIDRIMSGNYTEFKYSSIQPLVAILLGFGQETPEPNEENEQEQFYYETIEGYKIIVENKNSEIRHYKASLEHVENEVNYLRQENASKKELLDRMSEHITWLEQFINKNDIK
ncbi:MAG: hypothetical protein MJ092_01420 [Lachnospiraceae bacterium]|nr:hypothetical protein [Lachnospiraceae bacterium]